MTVYCNHVAGKPNLFSTFQDPCFRNLVAKLQDMPCLHEYWLTWTPRNAQSCEEAALSQTRSETRADLDHVSSDQDICRQRGADIALERVTLPAHLSGTRAYRGPGESVKLSAQSKLLCRDSGPADCHWRESTPASSSKNCQDFCTKHVEIIFCLPP